MVSPAAPAAPHTDAFETTLQNAGIVVGRAAGPEGGGWQGEPGRSSFIAYAVLFPTPGKTDGDLGDPNAYLDYEVQITGVAVTAGQVETLMDLIKSTLVGKQLPVAGRSSYRVQLAEGGRPVTPDRQVVPAEYYAVALFSLRTGPL